MREDIPGAFADFGQAIKLAPDNIEYLRQRALLYQRTRQPLRAVEDIDRLLKLKPDDVDALMMRAAMRLRLDRKADIRADLDAAAAAAPKPSDRRFELAQLYEAAESYTQAVSQYDLWIAAHPDDRRRPMALNGRCWARALANVEIDRALKDCNSALSAMPHTPAFLDSRGLVRLRMGDYVHAIADYNEALAANGKIAWSLYGRGIARVRLGQKEAGEADIAQAKALEDDLPDRARKLGITP
jgi:tetratricopeptide (TPR) repeat protein